MTGTEALHPQFERSWTPAPELRLGRDASSARLRLFGIGTLVSILLFCFSNFSNSLLGADIALPTVAPNYTIFVKADSLARETRGSYEVLAFRGSCQVRQGEFTSRCSELTMWVDQTPATEPNQPRKIICSMEGNVEIDWNGAPHLRDSRWMGRLFSFEDIEISVHSERGSGTIPKLDWNRANDSRVVPAQFSGNQSSGIQVGSGPPGTANSTGGSFPTSPLQLPNNTPGGIPGSSASNGGTPLSSPGSMAPALLPSSSSPPVGMGNGPSATIGTGSPGAPLSPSVQLGPTSGSATAPANTLPAPSSVPSLPGAVQWPTQGGTGNFTPLAIPEDGSAPYPAYGSALNNNSANSGTRESVPSVTTLAQPALPNLGPVGLKSIRFLARSSRRPIIKLLDQPDTGTSVATVSGGMVLEIGGIQLAQSGGTVMDLGTVTIEFDNAVIWKAGGLNLESLGAMESSPDQPIELYMEGNIVMRQGQRVIYADRMYYNVSTEYGMILSAEVLTPVPQYQGLLRLKADVLEQRNRQNFLAYGAALTSSRLGVPRYWGQADRLQLQDMRPEAPISPITETKGAESGTSMTNMKATSRNNFVYVGGLPVAYWPIFSTNLSKPSFYLSSIKVKNDRIFGSQVFTEFDLYQLLSLPPVDGTDWTLSADYLSQRGPALGTRFDLDRPLYGLGPTRGYIDAWGINDSGLDTLGADRTDMTPEATNRGRAIARFRNYLTPNIELWSELGYITDRNFLEQYFENEWDQQKDYSTALRLRRYNGNRMLDITGQARINPFFTETEQLPKLDHYWLGQDLGDYLTWSARSSVGYVHQRVTNTPTDPKDAANFTLLPWETDSEGLRAITRQEINAPVNLGAWNIIPYLSGEAGFWGEDVNGDQISRLTGQGGIRTNLPFWRAYPGVESELFDIRGLAHKVNLKSDLFYADSTQDLDSFPLYEPLDDNSQEHFRRRMITTTFGGVRPPEFDERSYALRQGMQRWITASSSEIVDDMTQLRFGVHQRLQTKRGIPGRERIVDLVTFDIDAIYFPKAERDNFGEDVGAINYAFRYQIGDRMTLLSDGYFDVFSQGLKSVSAGAMFSRPGRADAYIGLLSLEGPISSNVLNGYFNYRMNEKWLASGGAVWDFAEIGSIGQTLSLTRIGESALIRFGINVDSGRDNVSFNFNIEPRFLQSRGLGAVGGQLIPPAGMFGIE